MKLETYLNAMIKAHTDYESDWIVSPKNWDIFLTRRKRQKNVFRVRILRMDSEKDSTIERLRRNNATFASAAVRKGTCWLMNRRMEPETETQRAYREFGDAWEKLRDIIYKELAEPLVKKLAEILDKIT